MKLAGDKIYLRFLEETDAEALLDLRVRNKAFFQKYSPTVGDDFYTLDFTRKFIRRSEEQREKDGLYSFGIFLNVDGQLVGTVSLSHILRGPLQKCLIGYSLDKRHNGNGYTTQAVSLAVNYAFNELKLHRIEAGTMLSNIGSMRVLEKAGFQREGVERKGVKINDRWEDHQIFAIISDRD
jgi:ribosomal-protein-alanine N-acetyltransferase